MKNINRVTLMGHLAADPECKTTSTQKTLCSFVLATHNEWWDQEGKSQRSVDFHRVVAWEALAEKCRDQLRKGLPVVLEGRLTNRSYEGADKVRHFITEVVLQNLYTLAWKEKPGEEEGAKVESHDLVGAV